MNDTMKRIVQLAIANNAPEDLALGFIRYEVVRRMNPRSFADLVRGNVMGKRFDDLVDEAVSASYAATIEVCYQCKRDTRGEITWPLNDGGKICQECWEDACGKLWWIAVQEVH